MTTTPRKDIERRLRAGEDAAEIAADLSLDCIDGAVVLPSWFADDGQAPTYYEDPSDGEQGLTSVSYEPGAYSEEVIGR